MSTEFASYEAPQKTPAPVACDWCGEPTQQVCIVQLLDRTGTERKHTVCPGCNEKIKTGLAAGQAYKTKVREERAKFLRDKREKRRYE